MHQDGWTDRQTDRQTDTICTFSQLKIHLWKNNLCLMLTKLLLQYIVTAALPVLEQNKSSKMSLFP